MSFPPRRVSPGQPIRAEDYNALVDYCTANTILSSAGVGVFRTAAGTALSVAGDGADIAKAKTGGSGIGAGSSGGATPGSGTVTLYEWTGSALSLGSATVTAYNFTTTAVGANKVVTIAMLNYGVWEVILEPC
jgi:hypothetical protein